MPAKSKAQQALFGMALSVRRGEMKRNEVDKEVLEIVDGPMTDKEIEDFASTKTKGLKKHVSEMKSLYAYLTEGVSTDKLDRSDDDIKNSIIDELGKYKIVYLVKTVDAALDEITDKKTWWQKFLDKNDVKGADHIYWMKCWNGGDTIRDFGYNIADVASHKNNTDVKWFFIVRGKDVTVIKYRTRYYGQQDTKEEIYSFTI